MISSYYDQLTEAAARNNVRLLDAIKTAGVPTSTFYRWRQGVVTPNLEVASRVMNEIESADADRRDDPTVSDPA